MWPVGPLTDLMSSLFILLLLLFKFSLKKLKKNIVFFFEKVVYFFMNRGISILFRKRIFISIK
jgi:hypothetical protein